MNPFIFFLHIPKTGGTTLLHDIMQQYDDRKYYLFYMAEKEDHRYQEFENTLKEKSFEKEIAVGHFDYGWHLILPCKRYFTYFTILRDPVERVVSEYYYILRTENHPLHKVLTEGDFDLGGYVKSFSGENDQVEKIAGLSTMSRFGVHDVSRDNILTVAKNHLKYHFGVVGLLERYEDTIYLLNERFGWNLSFDGEKKNVSTDRLKVGQIDERTISRIREKNKLDLELYDFAKCIFEMQLEKCKRF